MAKERGKSMLDTIKDKIANSGSSYGDTFYVAPDKKKKIRFLSDFEEAVGTLMHDKWQEVKPTICMKHFGKKCANCEKEGIRSRENFCWSIYDYEEGKVKIMQYPASPGSPIPGMITAYETYGTLLDRDYVIVRKGTGVNTTYQVMPLDKSKFKKKAKPFEDEEIYKKLLAMAGKSDSDDDDDDDDDDEDQDYSEMSKKELRALCKERGIKFSKNDDEDELIELLEENDSEEDEDEDEDDDE